MFSLFLKKFKIQNKFFDTQQFFKFPQRFSSHYVNHRDTSLNNDTTPFDFTPENYKKIDEILVTISNLGKIP